MLNENLINKNPEINNNDLSNISQYINTQYSNDIQLLIEMGYSSKLIKKTYAFLKPHSIEEAVTFISLENGKYQHDFYIDYKHKNFTKCYVCGNPKEMHINSSHKIENIFEKEFKEQNEEDKEIKITITNEEEDCDICKTTYLVSENKFTENLKCKHRYCNECWTNYIVNKINGGDVINIKCMAFECSEILTEEFIKKFIKTKVLLDKYENFKLRYHVLRDPNNKFCPYPGCDSYAIKKDDNKFVKCIKNGHKFCFECLEHNWHKGKCQQTDEQNFLKWKEKKFIKQCPNCHMFTEKNEGCNHMKCAECKYEWCWLCEQQYNYDHYKSGVCDGLQFFKAENEEQIKKVLADPNDKNRDKYNPYLNDYRFNRPVHNIPERPRPLNNRFNNYRDPNNIEINYENFQRKTNCFLEFLIYFFLSPFVIYINYYDNWSFEMIANNKLIFFFDLMAALNIVFLLLYYIIYLNITLIIHISIILYFPMYKAIKKKYFYFLFHRLDKRF